MNNIYFIATPIGNLKDISQRALDTLNSSDIIACEDPQKSKILLNNYNINKKIIKYNEGNKDLAVDKIIMETLNGKTVSYITEAGTPTISDPGYLLTQKAIEKNLNIVPIPGPSAVTTALMVSGVASNSFIFLGFLPKKKSAINKFISKIKTKNLPVVIYVSPHKVSSFVKYAEKIIPDRYLVIARELTKRYEEITRGYIKDIKNRVKKNIRGEYTIIIDKNHDNKLENDESFIIEKGKKLINSYSLSETSKILSKLYSLNRRKIYDLLQKYLKN